MSQTERPKAQTVEEVVKTFLRYDPFLHHVHIPNAKGRYRSLVGEFDVDVQMNSQGMRDREFSTDRPAGVSRVLVLGDSVAEGAQVSLEATFSKVLEERLNHSGQGGWEVLNAAVSSYSPAPEYLYLKEFGLKFDPQYVVVVFAFNDVMDDHNYYKTAVLDDDLLPLELPPDEALLQAEEAPKGEEPKVPVTIAIKNYLKERSKLYRTLAETYDRYQIRRGMVAFGGISPPRGHKPENPATENPFGIFKENLSAEEEKAWQTSERLLAAIGRLCRSAGVEFLLVIAPPGNQVNAGEWKVGKKWWGFKADEVLRSRAMQDRLVRLGQREGIRVVDLLPYFQEISGPEKLYFDFDGHWTPQGHLRVAEQIHEAMIKVKKG
jgi:lysophospholipase L1-like esterase